VSVPLLQALLSAEHAAVYGYGVVGGRLDDATRSTALAAYDSHRARRDQLEALLSARGAAPVRAEPAYDVATASAEQALALAVRIEEGLALRWRDLVGATDAAELRALGIAGLQETAVRAASWRRLAGSPQVTVALPGSA
jgi:hypothetical protein